jgi:pyruvate carboxylase
LGLQLARLASCSSLAVKKGDPIAVLSAVKMEMVISSPHAGKIDQIKVTEGVLRHFIYKD